jgi:hypothetical protein
MLLDTPKNLIVNTQQVSQVETKRLRCNSLAQKIETVRLICNLTKKR